MGAFRKLWVRRVFTWPLLVWQGEQSMQRIKVVDSHTGGEPTRVVVEGIPDLGGGPLAARRERFGREFARSPRARAHAPRAPAGALLFGPEDETCVTGVIYFNNVGTIGMCGHGTIGLMITLAYLGRIL